MKLRKIAYCLLALFLSSAIMAATPASITYQNQRGSILTLTFQPVYQNTGTLSGTFTTAVGNCPEDMHVPIPVTGYFNGSAIAVTVNFPHCNQVIAMTGHVSADQHSIQTLWLDANNVADTQGKHWNSNIIGTDTYQQIAS